MRSAFAAVLFGCVALQGTDALAVSACQDVCLNNSPSGPVVCLTNADCTSYGGICLATTNSSGGSGACCDQDEEDAVMGNCKCGDELVGNVSLGHDIICTSGSALTVDSTNESLDLNGYKIACTGTGGDCGIGVTLAANNAEVRGNTNANKGGRIEGFVIGVQGNNTNTGTTAKQLTITDAGLCMTFGIAQVAHVEKNLISGAACGVFGGNSIEVGTTCTTIKDNLVTDSTRGISIGTSQGNSGCTITHNRAVSNDYGFIAIGNFDSASDDNIFINNSVADYFDWTANRLSTASNVCRVAGQNASCTLNGMNFTP